MDEGDAIAHQLVDEAIQASARSTFIAQGGGLHPMAHLFREYETVAVVMAEAEPVLALVGFGLLAHVYEADVVYGLFPIELTSISEVGSTASESVHIIKWLLPDGFQATYLRGEEWVDWHDATDLEPSLKMREVYQDPPDFPREAILQGLVERGWHIAVAT